MFIVLDKKIILGVASLAAAFLIIAFFVFGSAGDSPVSKLDNKKIVIDAGHGGIDGGSVSDSGIFEKDLNLKIAKKLKAVFEENGYMVAMTREEDNWLSEKTSGSVRSQKNSDLKKRAELANESGAGLFISIHINKYESPNIFGAQTFYSENDEEGKIYAESIMESLRLLNTRNKRLAKTHPNKNLVFQSLKITGVLVECGFISNPEELELLKTEEYQKKLAESIYNGVKNVTNK